MTEQHRATPSDWAWLEGNSAAWSRGLITLRDRVEALEERDALDAEAWTAMRRSGSELRSRLAAAEQRISELEGMRQALVKAEAALADIGDAEREPGDDVAWCEHRAAQALPVVRAALGGNSSAGLTGSNHPKSPDSSASAGSLVERVRTAIVEHGDGYTYTDEARAAIYVIADEVERRGAKGLDLDPGETADWLRREAGR